MKNNKNLIKKIEAEAKKFFKNAKGCHDWTHIERVRNLSLKIGKEEKADLFILEISAILHDIGRKEEIKKKGKFCHAQKGAELAEPILKKYNIKDEDTKNILHSIKAHRFRNKEIPETIEAKCLYDADKIDSIGAVGIGRDFLFAGHSGSGNLYTGNEKNLNTNKKDYCYTKEDSAIMEYEVKLKHVKDKIITPTGKKLAQERHNFMVKFFERFWEEVEGKK